MCVTRLLSRAGSWRRYGRGLAVFCCVALMSGAASATVEWGRIGEVTTLTSGQLCKNDGKYIICDSTTPTISGGAVGIGTTSPNASALLDVYSTTQGLLPPRMTTTQRNAISSPATGLTIYNTSLDELETYDGTTNGWEAVGAYAADAAGSNGQVQFNSGGDLGASANLFWDNTNYRLGIGTSTPANALDVNGAASIGYNVAAPSNGLIVNGNVGIGTTSPSKNLQVEQDYNGMTGIALVNATSGTNAFTQYGSIAGSTDTWLYTLSQGYTTSGRFIAGGTVLENSGAGGLGLSALAGPVLIYTNSGTEAMRITSAGYVGIGTTAPVSKLQVSGVITSGSISGSYGEVDLLRTSDGAVVNKMYADSSENLNLWENGGTGGINFYTGGAQVMTVTYGGYVGIGTTSPSKNLQVEQDYNGMTGIALVNATSGTNAFTQYGSIAGSTDTWLYTLSQGYTTSGRFIAGGTVLENSGAGGLGLSALAGPVLIYTNSGTEAMRITSAGYVGIGTTAPVSKLQVSGVITSGSISGSYGEVDLLRTSDGAVVNKMYADSSENLNLWENGGTGGINFYTGGAQVMTVTYGGYVGIGTTSPGAKLDIAGSLGDVQVTSNGNSIVFTGASTTNYITSNDANSDLRIRTGGANDRVAIESNGNVGIGTTTIASKFEVNGNASIGYSDTAAPTNGLIVNGNVGIGTASPATSIKADINGLVKVAGSGSEPCTAAQVGAIRYNPTGNYFELCSYP